MRPDALTTAVADTPLLSIENLSVQFTRAGKQMRAVQDVSLHVEPGETLGLVGESGSGKTTIGRALLRLLPEANTDWQGSIRFQGTDLATLSKADMRRMRGRLQMIFQDPVSSFNPRRKIEDIVSEGLEIHGVEPSQRKLRMEAALYDVGFSLADVAGRRPHQFSGGQCQRIAIARALAVQPELIVCDEPVASLDVSVQAHIINLLQDIREARRLTMIFISHDLAVVKNVSDKVAVLYMGRVVEIGTGDQVYNRPAHPYTRTLLEAVPIVDASRKIKPALDRMVIPSRNRPPEGCAFRLRCPRAADRCAMEEPVLGVGPGGQSVACHFPHDEPAPNFVSESA